jgi:hypothetical protein
MSARQEDPVNGWIIIKDNPLSKVGVFEYSGKQISDKLEPNKIYKVFRPPEELSDPETIESFKTIPWTNDHPRTLFNLQTDGHSSAEGKEIKGVTTDNIRFDGKYLRGDIKVFTRDLAEEIQSGKKELSIGYNCIPKFETGVYNGERYDVVQREIRGNHLALVDEGRAGPDVAVLDHRMMTFDTREINHVDLENNKTDDAKTCDAEGEGSAITLESLNQRVNEIAEAVKKLAEAGMAKVGDEDKTTEKKDSDEKPAEKEETKDAEEDKKAPAMDAKLKQLETEIAILKNNGIKTLLNEVSQRDQLSKKLSTHIGVFDHADKTLAEVAEYGVKKLNLTAEKGQEIAVLNGFFAAHDRHVNHARAANTSTMDSKSADDSVAAYINGEVK